MSGYTKLFGSIVHSTVWREPDHVRLTWITMLALADRDGIVEASIPGLADAARVSLEQCEDALARLSGPDKYSRSKAHDGRRVEECDGGWRLLNHETYRKRASAEEARKKNAARVRKHREKRSCNALVMPVTDCTKCNDIADPDPDPDPDTTTPKPPLGVEQSQQSQPNESPDSKIPCPENLTLTDAQIATLESSLVPRWAIYELTKRFVLKSMSDTSDRRTLAGWRKCLAIAVNGDWSDRNKRPRREDAPEPTKAEIEDRKAKRETEQEQLRRRHQARIVAEAKARGDVLPELPPRGEAQRQVLRSLTGGAARRS